MTLGELVEGFFLPVEVSEGDKEGDTTDSGETMKNRISCVSGEGPGQANAHCTQHVVPNQVRVVGQRHESFTDGGGDGVGEQGNGLDNGSHVSGSLGVSVFQDGNGCEDLSGRVSRCHRGVRDNSLQRNQ